MGSGKSTGSLRPFYNPASTWLPVGESEKKKHVTKESLKAVQGSYPHEGLGTVKGGCLGGWEKANIEEYRHCADIATVFAEAQESHIPHICCVRFSSFTPSLLFPLAAIQTQAASNIRHGRISMIRLCCGKS